MNFTYLTLLIYSSTYKVDVKKSVRVIANVATKG